MRKIGRLGIGSLAANVFPIRRSETSFCVKSWQSMGKGICSWWLGIVPRHRAAVAKWKGVVGYGICEHHLLWSASMRLSAGFTGRFCCLKNAVIVVPYLCFGSQLSRKNQRREYKNVQEWGTQPDIF